MTVAVASVLCTTSLVQGTRPLYVHICVCTILGCDVVVLPGSVSWQGTM